MKSILSQKRFDFSYGDIPFSELTYTTEQKQEGDVLTFEDMNHYTTVKTHMFNGIQHPAMLYHHSDGTVEVLREFTYEDYKNRMS